MQFARKNEIYNHQILKMGVPRNKKRITKKKDNKKSLAIQWPYKKKTP